MKKLLLIFSVVLFCLYGCGKSDSPQTSSTTIQDTNVKGSLPQEQRDFQKLVTDLPRIPPQVKGTRDEEQYLKKQNDLQDLWGMSESSNGVNKIGVTEIKDWKCYISNNLQTIDISRSVTCTPKGMTVQSNINLVNPTKDFDKVYLNDTLTISGRIRILEINPTLKFADVPNHYNLWIEQGNIQLDKK